MHSRRNHDRRQYDYQGTYLVVRQSELVCVMNSRVLYESFCRGGGRLGQDPVIDMQRNYPALRNLNTGVSRGQASVLGALKCVE